MRVVFFGSGRFAIPSLEAVTAAGHEIVAVVTQPDRPRGRGRALAPPPTRPVAERHGIAVLQPPRVKAPEAVAALGELGAELHVVVAYGQILSRALLELPPRGSVNVHASLLPRYRGAAPVQWAIARGESVTGVSTMLLDEGMDTGPVLLQRRTPIGSEETAPELEGRLAEMGAALLVETLEGLAEGALEPRPQDEAQASRAPILRKEDGRVDWTRPARELSWRVRGFQPWPGATAALRGRPLRLQRVAVLEHAGTADPGRVVAVDDAGILVACAAGSALRLVEVQPESRRAMPAAAFARGARLAPGDRFD